MFFSGVPKPDQAGLPQHLPGPGIDRRALTELKPLILFADVTGLKNSYRTQFWFNLVLFYPQTGKQNLLILELQQFFTAGSMRFLSRAKYTTLFNFSLAFFSRFGDISVSFEVTVKTYSVAGLHSYPVLTAAGTRVLK